MTSARMTLTAWCHLACRKRHTTGILRRKRDSGKGQRKPAASFLSLPPLYASVPASLVSCTLGGIIMLACNPHKQHSSGSPGSYSVLLRPPKPSVPAVNLDKHETICSSPIVHYSHPSQSLAMGLDLDPKHLHSENVSGLNSGVD